MRPETGLFVRSSEAPYYALLNPNTPRQERVLRAVGSMIALSFLSGQHLSIPLPTMFYARLVGHQMTLEDIQRDEPILYNSLNYIVGAPEEELEDYPLTINRVVHVPTVANRASLVILKVNSLISREVESKMNDIVFGFNRILSSNLASSHFLASEVRLMIEGSPVINVEDMIRSFRQNSEWLYNILRSMTQEELHFFWRFVSGDSQPLLTDSVI